MAGGKNVAMPMLRPYLAAAFRKESLAGEFVRCWHGEIGVGAGWRRGWNCRANFSRTRNVRCPLRRGLRRGLRRVDFPDRRNRGTHTLTGHAVTIHARCQAPGSFDQRWSIRHRPSSRVAPSTKRSRSNVSNSRMPSGSSACARTVYLPGRSGNDGNSSSYR